MILNYLLIFLLLLILELTYIAIADKCNVFDKPNSRSSHSIATIRGGGIVFILGAFVFSFTNNFTYPLLMLALGLTGFISFWDDVKGLSRRLRFLSHVIAIFLLLWQCNLLQMGWWLLPLFILLIGILNAYNFMDGINGITGFYSLAILFPIFFDESDLMFQEFIAISLISIIVFLLFNARKNARCFAGDIGSISIALIIIFVLMHQILETGDFHFVFFLTIYGIDSILTISQRLVNGENIFESHRKHLYQILVNEYNIPHLIISVIYAFIQLIINSWLIVQKPSSFIVILVVIVIGFIYLGLKFYLIKNYSKNQIDN